jgi:hypothetical protein
MIPPTVGLMSKATVTPALVMMAVSVAPGTVLGFQLAAVFHPPLTVLVQVMVAASARKLVVSSNATTTVATGKQIAAKVFIMLWFDCFWVNFRILPDLLTFLSFALNRKLFMKLTDARY